MLLFAVYLFIYSAETFCMDCMHDNFKIFD